MYSLAPVCMNAHTIHKCICVWPCLLAEFLTVVSSAMPIWVAVPSHRALSQPPIRAAQRTTSCCSKIFMLPQTYVCMYVLVLEKCVYAHVLQQSLNELSIRYALTGQYSRLKTSPVAESRRPPIVYHPKQWFWRVHRWWARGFWRSWKCVDKAIFELHVCVHMCTHVRFFVCFGER